MNNNAQHLVNCFTSLAERLTEQEFFSVVSAWRGPDGENSSKLKYNTTAILRKKILEEVDFTQPEFDGQLGNEQSFSGLIVSLTSIGPIVVEGRYSPHFGSHVRLAAAALGVEFSYQGEETK